MKQNVITIGLDQHFVETIKEQLCGELHKTEIYDRAAIRKLLGIQGPHTNTQNLV